MAKRRRKPSNRPRPQGARGGVRTAESGEVAETVEAGRARNASEGGPASRAARERGPATRGHLARAEKKELARRQREEVRRRVRRGERMRRLKWIVGGAVVVAAAVLLITRDSAPPERPETLPGELATEAPWPANSAQAEERAGLLGLPAAGGAQHVHANVRVFIDGEEQPVPIDIGINEGYDASLHTHSADGTVHVESNDAGYGFTLGEFFDVWGVRFSDTCLGASCAGGEDSLRVFVGGEEVSTGSIRDVSLNDQMVVVVAFGTEDELPDPIPSTFDFTAVQP